MALKAAHKVLVGIVWWVMAQSNMGILMHPHVPAAHDLVAGQSAGSFRESGSVPNKRTTDDSSRVASSIYATRRISINQLPLVVKVPCSLPVSASARYQTIPDSYSINQS